MGNAFFNALGFLTILPTGMPDSLEDVAKNMYLFPIVGAIIGLLAGLFLHFISVFLPIGISAALGFFALLALTGLHHLDGLLDFGDAIILRAPKEKRIEAMHDTVIGAGGFFIGLFAIILGIIATYEFVAAGESALTLFIVSETAAKLAMVVAAGFGRPAFDGTGSIFVKILKKRRWQIWLSVFITVLIISPFTGSFTLLLIALPFFSAAAFVWTSNRLIGGLSGDVFGALNEVTRLFVMVVMIWTLL